jgi:hypothetical protein
MERRIQKITVSFFCAVMAVSLYAQNISADTMIRLPLWASIDAYPGLSEQSVSTAELSTDTVFNYSIGQLKKTAPFFITGMVYGWRFSYTPYDKTRAVSEYFEYSAVRPLDSDTCIKYTKPWIQDNRLYVWIEFERNNSMIRVLDQWNTISHPEIKGSGTGKISDGFAGIQHAAEAALKNAVRAYYRECLKNKPKEIDGNVIIAGQPRIGVASGRYVVELDFFLETDRILKYTTF